MMFVLFSKNQYGYAIYREHTFQNRDVCVGFSRLLAKATWFNFLW